MALNLTVADDILKNQYLPPIQEALNNASVLFSRLDKDETTQDVTGKNFTVPIHYGRNLSAGTGRAEGGVLPTAGAQRHKAAVVPNKYTYGSIEVSGQVIAATKDAKGAFVKAVSLEVEGLTTDFKRAINRQLHGNGTDALAYWTTADDTSGTVVDDGNGYVFTHLPVGQTLTCDLIDASDHSTKLGDSIVVTLGSETSTGFNITWTGTVTGSADGDYLVVEDTLGQQMMGLEGIISASDPVLLAGGLHGLPVATFPWFAAQVVGSDSTKVDLSVVNMQKVITKIASGSNYTEKDIKFILCSYQVRDKYVELATNLRLYYNTMTLDGGWEAVTYNNLPIVPDNQSKRGRMYFVVPKTMAIFRTSDFNWMDMDGSIWQRKITSSGVHDAYMATLFHYGDLGCKNRNGNGVLLGINE